MLLPSRFCQTSINHLEQLKFQNMRAFHLISLVLLTPSAHSFSPFPQKASDNHLLKLSPLFHQTTLPNALKPNTSLNVGKTSSETAYQNEGFVQMVDKIFLARVVQIMNHAPALASLCFFGLVAMTSMMGGPGPVVPTLPSVLTKTLGSTTNAQFSSYFPTLITPPSYVFLIWPLISIVQFVVVGLSALLPTRQPLLSVDDLSALSLANLAATAWLFVSSKASATILPISSLLVLPLVPIISGYPLRMRSTNASTPSPQNVAFQLFSSFTTIASLLALTVELQHGGRLPFFKGKAELAAMIFLFLFDFTVVFGTQGIVAKSVNAFAITAILAKRVNAVLVTGTSGIGKLLLSVSFIYTLVSALNAGKKLFEKAPADMVEEQ